MYLISILLIFLLITINTIFLLIIKSKNIWVITLHLCFLYSYIHHHIREKIWHCFVSFFHVSPSFSLYPFIFLLLPSPFLFALLAGSFGGALCSIARRDGRASSENPISVTSELKAIGRYRGITRVTAECYREHTAPRFPCRNGHFSR